MIRAVFKALLWGIGMWVVFNVLIFFGVGVYRGFFVSGPDIPISATLSFILRFIALLFALSITLYVFLKEERRRKTIIVEREVSIKPKPAFQFKPMPPSTTTPPPKPEPLKSTQPTPQDSSPFAGQPKSMQPTKPPSLGSMFQPKPKPPEPPKASQSPLPPGLAFESPSSFPKPSVQPPPSKPTQPFQPPQSTPDGFRGMPQKSSDQRDQQLM